MEILSEDDLEGVEYQSRPLIAGENPPVDENKFFVGGDYDTVLLDPVGEGAIVSSSANIGEDDKDSQPLSSLKKRKKKASSTGPAGPSKRTRASHAVKKKTVKSKNSVPEVLTSAFSEGDSPPHPKPTYDSNCHTPTFHVIRSAPN